MNVKIKENVDGSVVISQDGKYFFSVDKNSEIRPTINAELVRELKSNKLCATYNANDIKTYLVQDAPEVSLPATAKYVTLQSELGNYITMNEEEDAIVVSNEPLTFRVFATDLNAVVPSFFISTDYEEGARFFLFNPEDSVNYYVGAGQYDKDYQWKEDIKKAIFKAGILNETADTLVTDIKGDLVEVANKANNKGVKGGLNRFKFQIVLAPGEDDLYLIRQLKANDLEMDAYTNDKDIEMNYLTVLNGRVVWGPKETAEMFAIAETTSPTANEAVAAAEVSVVAVNGAIIVKGAAGKVVTVANILGQTIANQVAASDNVTIAAPAGIAVVTVDGEATKVVVK
ncbi:MAG: DUF6383 domain-containing protein [Parabacteroides sp.]|nr:DUF6383 domain-containing protein [Parabacteroides sp.]